MTTDAKRNLRLLAFWVGTPSILFGAVAFAVGRSHDLAAVEKAIEQRLPVAEAKADSALWYWRAVGEDVRVLVIDRCNETHNPLVCDRVRPR